MEATFNDKKPAMSDEERRLENAARAEKGEAQMGGSAGRETVADTNPNEHDATTGGPGSAGNKPVQDPVM